MWAGIENRMLGTCRVLYSDSLVGATELAVGKRAPFRFHPKLIVPYPVLQDVGFDTRDGRPDHCILVHR